MSTPEFLNHYRIIGPLGKGGMGEVFIADDTRLHRKVALKILSKTMAADPERRERFAREAQAVAALNHPNIVTIHSVEEADGVPFLTMELVEGQPLGAHIPPGGMPLDTFLRIAVGVTDAIGEAHHRGITHRDLKPANILVTSDGRVKVLDFGLAKLREAHLEDVANDVTRMPSAELTGEGRIIGTVAYMSPEQAEGKAVDQRSDIFSLGVVLHEMATGERPFKGDTNVSVISSILKDTPRPVTDVKPELPPALAKVIRRALSKDPSRRYQTATDLRNDLEDLKQEVDSGITVAPPQVASRARRRRGRVLGLAALLLLIAAVSAYQLMKRGGDGPVTFLELDRVSRLTSTGNATLAAVSPDGRYVAHVKVNGAQASLWMRQTATPSDVQIVPPAQVRYDGVALGPDGDYVYYVTYAPTGGVGTLYRVPALGGASQRVLEDVDSRVSFSPDGSQFTFTRGAPAKGVAWVMIANADGSGARQLAQLEPPDQFTLGGPSWSPDGKTILAPAQSRRVGPAFMVVSIDVASGKTTRLEGTWNAVGDIEWLSDGRSFLVIASEAGPASNQLWQVTMPRYERQRFTNDLNNYVSASMSRDMRSIVTVQAETIANLWVTTPEALAAGTQITRGRTADGNNGADWTQDGRVVYASNAGGSQQLWILPATGGDPTQLTTGSDASFAPKVSPDGRAVFFQRFKDGRMRIWRMNLDGSEQKPLTEGPADFLPVPGRDGFVYYTSQASQSPRAFKVPVDGGASIPLGDFNFRVVDISPSNELLGVTWDEEHRRSALAIVPASGGAPRMLREVPAFAGTWTRDGTGIAYPAATPDGTGVFRYTLATRRIQQDGVIPGNLFNAVWSHDGKQIVLSRGSSTSDVVLMTTKVSTGRPQ